MLSKWGCYLEHKSLVSGIYVLFPCVVIFFEPYVHDSSTIRQLLPLVLPTASSQRKEYKGHRPPPPLPSRKKVVLLLAKARSNNLKAITLVCLTGNLPLYLELLLTEAKRSTINEELKKTDILFATRF